MKFLGTKVPCDLILRVTDYNVTISFGCILYCDYFNLFCNVWVRVCVGVLLVYVLLFTVFLYFFIYVYLFLFILSLLV